MFPSASIALSFLILTKAQFGQGHFHVQMRASLPDRLRAPSGLHARHPSPGIAAQEQPGVSAAPSHKRVLRYVDTRLRWDIAGPLFSRHCNAIGFYAEALAITVSSPAASKSASASATPSTSPFPSAISTGSIISPRSPTSCRGLGDGERESRQHPWEYMLPSECEGELAKSGAE
jgi:hypothetical protein